MENKTKVTVTLYVDMGSTGVFKEEFQLKYPKFSQQEFTNRFPQNRWLKLLIPRLRSQLEVLIGVILKQ